MIDINKYCKMFGKRPSHFLDNAIMVGQPFKTQRGAKGFTKIPKSMLPQFFIWVDNHTKQMILRGKTADDVVESINNIRVHY